MGQEEREVLFGELGGRAKCHARLNSGRGELLWQFRGRDEVRNLVPRTFNPNTLKLNDILECSVERGGMVKYYAVGIVTKVNCVSKDIEVTWIVAPSWYAAPPTSKFPCDKRTRWPEYWRKLEPNT